MVTISNHGGGCCGIAHIHGFDGTPLHEFDQAIIERDLEGNRGRLLEAVLSQRQVQGTDRRIHQSIIDAGGWPRVLASRGFVLDALFSNSNSGNNVYRFTRLGDENRRITELTDFVFPWRAAAIQEALEPVPEIPVEIPPEDPNDFSRRPAPVDPNLPVMIYERALGRSYPAHIERVEGRVIAARSDYRDRASYCPLTGTWFGDPILNTRARLYNPAVEAPPQILPEIEPVLAPAPAPAPVEEPVFEAPAPDVLDMFRARFTNRRMSLLRFNSLDELRDRYPDVRTVVFGNDIDGFDVFEERG